METTRQTVLHILRRRQATVEELSKELGLAPATIRRHLDILARDGHVNVAQVRRKTGRPHYVFSLSEAGEDLFPKHYVRTTNRLIEEIIALGPDETAGRSGSELADLVFERMAQRLAQRVGPRVHGSTLDERIASLVEALAEEGMAFDVEKADGGYVLTGHTCPCPKAFEKQDTVCVHGEGLLSLLLATEVTRERRGDSGHEGDNAYRVRERAGAGAAGHPSLKAGA
ncbi:MAG: ArsR family transcriptional regulator [Dehalococcoidia bacterium]|nr:ArsR family transcriptional regulator [Dehalococcoidia bacterium]